MRDCYLHKAKEDKSIIVINGERTIEEVHKDIVSYFNQIQDIQKLTKLTKNGKVFNLDD
ncbi:MAG: hypothetical protein ACK4MM_02695 [Fervidobacterium sp.]